ncbi:mucin-19-like [Penaeus chinensis]|uniref:mucin-19-like n=1 Tax=Penaeus chinensis TaxID=139456 RepID=UPI001FB786A0|nr:mucin-19-like [Penaeus chinensis]
MKNFLFVIVAAAAAAQQFPDVSVRLAGDGFFRRGTGAASSSPSAGGFQPRASFPTDGKQASPGASGGGRSGSPSGSSASGATGGSASSSGSRFRSGSAIGRQADVGDVDEAVDGVFEPLNLPASASSLLGSISTAFSCDDLPYGYYADRDNACRVYHVCYPALFADGDSVTYQYSFMCGAGTVFDQRELTCVDPSVASPCEESYNYYFTNEQFGLPEERLQFL